MMHEIPREAAIRLVRFSDPDSIRGGEERYCTIFAFGLESYPYLYREALTMLETKRRDLEEFIRAQREIGGKEWSENHYCITSNSSPWLVRARMDGTE